MHHQAAEKPSLVRKKHSLLRTKEQWKTLLGRARYSVSASRHSVNGNLLDAATWKSCFSLIMTRESNLRGLFVICGFGNHFNESGAGCEAVSSGPVARNVIANQDHWRMVILIRNSNSQRLKQ
jgi:hypothetical protein